MDSAGPPLEGAGNTAAAAGGAGPDTAGTVARALPPAEPGPTIRRPADADLAAGKAGKAAQGRPRGRPAGKPRGRPRKDATAAPGPATTAAPPAGSARDLAATVYAQHDRAARWLSMPELAISRSEAQDVADALARAGELSGWQPSGPAWGWLGIVYVLGGVYAGKVMALAEKRRAAADTAPPGHTPPRPAAPPPPRVAPIAATSAAVIVPPPPAPPAAAAPPAPIARPPMAPAPIAAPPAAPPPVSIAPRGISSAHERLDLP